MQDNVTNQVEAHNDYTVLELFAGAGGLALGLEKAGLRCVALNEIDKWACQTLLKNRPNWKVLEGDIKEFDFTEYHNRVDIVTGGFPCQAYSYAGKKLGLADAWGTLFYELTRVVRELNPPLCIGENVRGLFSHENGKTLQWMISILDEIGYNVVPVQVLKAVKYCIPIELLMDLSICLNISVWMSFSSSISLNFASKVSLWYPRYLNRNCVL